METKAHIINTNIIRAIASICIVLTHLGSVNVPKNSPIGIFYTWGYLCVGIFFFYSGYNSVFSFISSEKWGGREYVVKKIIRIYLPFVLINVLYVMTGSFLYGTQYRYPVLCVLGLYGVTENILWYVYAIMVFYIAFFLVFVCVKDKIKELGNKEKIYLTIFCVIVYELYRIGWHSVCVLKGLDADWDGNDIAPFALLIGMVYAIWKELAARYIAKYKMVLFFLISYILIYTHTQGFVNKEELILWGYDWFDKIPPVAAAVLSEILIFNETIQNRVLATVGKMSYELYICHPLFMKIFRNDHVYIESNKIYLAAYLVTLFAFSFYFNKCSSMAMRKIYGLDYNNSRNR